MISRGERGSRIGMAASSRHKPIRALDARGNGGGGLIARGVARLL
jgi:hypothetical protein